MTDADWMRFGQKQYAPPGQWRFTVARTGATAVYNPSFTIPDFRTRFTASGAHLTIGDTPICPYSGQYSWTRAGGQLTLKRVKDKCALRAALFDGTWTKK